MRFFNTAGPVNCQDHYCISPLERFDIYEIKSLIAQKKYFVLHAPRQTGKTSCLLALMDHLNAVGDYRCLYVNVEPAQAARENVHNGLKAILSEMASRARYCLNDNFLKDHWSEVLEKSGEFAALGELLSQWAETGQKPLVILIDEIDSLVGDTLISVLRQLRAGYDKRPKLFPQSIVLCGVRDVRDYRIHSNLDKAIITGGSAFNIKAKSLIIGNFTKENVQNLFKQHTEETGQLFNENVMDMVWDMTCGQPWLVNALGYEVCFEMKVGRDRIIPITTEMIEQAKENIIIRRETHIDQLVDKLSEERVRRVIEPILTSTEHVYDFHQDDLQYVVDLGLIKVARNGEISVANLIYQEIIPRELSWNIQVGIAQKPARYLFPDGLLDMEKLLSSFQEFFRQHSEHWVERFAYKEAGPQLLLQAFLQRIVNSGGSIEREYGLGRKRTDLLIIWHYKYGIQRVVIELKIIHTSLNITINEGLRQVVEYMDRCNTRNGHLIVFDRSQEKAWEEKIFKKEEEFQGKKISVWGM